MSSAVRRERDDLDSLVALRRHLVDQITAAPFGRQVKIRDANGEPMILVPNESARQWVLAIVRRTLRDPRFRGRFSFSVSVARPVTARERLQRIRPLAVTRPVDVVPRRPRGRASASRRRTAAPSGPERPSRRCRRLIGARR